MEPKTNHKFNLHFKYDHKKLITIPEIVIIKIRNRALIIISIGLSLIFPNFCHSQGQNEVNKIPIPKIISFNPDSNQYQSLFNGEKDSVVFYSGVVTLYPNSSGEVHNTEIYEEMIIPLEGEGQLRVPNQENLNLKFGKIALVPPFTEHQMVNTGTKNLKYIYVATTSKQ